MTSTERVQMRSSAWGVKHGIIGGAIAALVFGLAEIVGSWLLMGRPLAPAKIWASIPLRTPPGEIPLGTAIPVGLPSHVLLTVFLGVIFGLIVAKIPSLRGSTAATVAAGVVYGTIVWILNLYVVAPAVGLPWFSQPPYVPPFIYHTVFFGLVLGIYFSRDRGRTRGGTRHGDDEDRLA